MLCKNVLKIAQSSRLGNKADFVLEPHMSTNHQKELTP